MNMEYFLRCLEDYANSQSIKTESGESVISTIYSCYSDMNRLDDVKIRADFDELYRAMNGMPLRDVDRVIYPVCTLCRDHEKSGFMHGVQIGVRLIQELKETG